MKKYLILFLCACMLLSYGTVLAVYATEQTTAAESETQELTQTSVPTTASYVMVNPAAGWASGTLNFYLPEGHNAVSFSLYWGDANGNRLAGYAPLLTQAITSNPVLVGLGDGCSSPAEAKFLLLYTKSERFGECITPYRIPLQEVKRPETGKLISEFVIVSDLHMGRDQLANDRFVAMLKDVKANGANVSGIIVAGDLVDAADDEYYATLDSLYASVPGVPALYRGIGHHEYLTKGTYEYNADAHKDNLKKFLSHVTLTGGAKPQTPYYSTLVGGQTVIFIGADSYINGDAVYSKEQLYWIESTLRSAGSQKPVFIVMHEPIPNTVSGSTDTQGYGDVYNHVELKQLLQSYKNVFVFSGHTHWTMAATRTINVTSQNVTYFNTGAVASLWNDVGGNGYEVQGSQGYYVTVYENALLVRGRDFENGQWLPDAYFLLSTKQPEQSTTAPSTKPPTTTAPDEDGEEEKEGLSKSKLLLLAIVAGAVALLAFVAVFGIQPKNNP